MEKLTHIIDRIGVSNVARLCGITSRAVYKWRALNTLPRTDYTGETQYAEILALALNNGMTAEDIKQLANPANN
ncbi:hypothetical protein EV694_1727 [Volucribacter psittacicida]|uniref:YdaS antitoxin of YdaST toxin-antitoxin system n=1 Tax=Volucribacter psittacicida TaxID=203482 RepID=A0A4V2PB87_9PAST|nr:hypothetical protein EV694_1727 [Volucribacter psittacicida]